ncbi:GNAT family N-acetyltransferase [Rhizobium sp. BK376]|uniref:GNAT family N-acetyltransferase n=1 Tax=Rhizobium sp. BK376 TaxID=2512149 RepID=UPI0010D6B547|nr:GNAT family N-acetyltransferase [Rhizobium sp. BK376]TCR82145.1 RimJ/RimL family protein N-acetyltransferase [Rhizobium sp. BK376]
MSAENIILETPRLALVRWNAEDVSLVHELHAATEMVRYYSDPTPWTREKAAERINSWFDEEARFGVAKYKLLDRHDGRFLGRAGFSPFGEPVEFELGYAIRRDAWGKGYASEIAEGLRDWFFRKGIANHFIAFTHPENLASQRVLTKIGMRDRMPITIDGITCATFEFTAGMR